MLQGQIKQIFLLKIHLIILNFLLEKEHKGINLTTYLVTYTSAKKVLKTKFNLRQLEGIELVVFIASHPS